MYAIRSYYGATNIFSDEFQITTERRIMTKTEEIANIYLELQQQMSYNFV